MRSWPIPTVPDVPGDAVALSLYDSADEEIRPVEGSGLYVCGITPYDSTHLGHAATYVTFDLVYRLLADNGEDVHYVQNITDVDDPLFERAERDGVDWRELGESQVELFRTDMEQLNVIPPRHYIGAMEAVDEVIEMVQKLLDVGAAYVVDDEEYPDIYASIDATKHFGYESNYSREQMEEFFAERGGDPERPGKRDPLDALLWRVHREGEPSWNSPFGAGRPGWHIECSAIAANRLGVPFAVQGGGSDLKFPHHEFSASHAEAATGQERMAGHYVHTGMIGLEGTKMSKSLGNLVFVHKLTEQGEDPSAIRLGILAGHYRDDRDWSDEILAHATERLNKWRHGGRSVEETRDYIQRLRERLADDLDTPGALAVVDEWAEGSDPAGRELITQALDGLLGVRL
ncbi:cysteine--1-D-myo-inosityl 2-amino-2-deoxy-alpha-D-glucopyranoside ligase [Corynebacterium yudongzhengii]|uniref:L-cysteine:1D-myo-inositol 2-amino-2-deoxy-alpha-D-glucopyranoside ligase n=1 Tax=Corynebacterium yudongzhengii TaxID=2080740 RepID=A0A2U1T8G0_9CORY|nr:cysteine--1-D-myo-inosityl 2-amino-2-deoxy-alpha-D-glucopyranoside ligase [Corynebacterium yudongzhengii]AWB81894.1 cysteine--1-D-myo-inosityl 2-amino-2-deoxy-alpha-D-glucopyranoside ligase [Corynebacterium yudongzhengii]PWC02286.1 cysteine--1-D-myo-inosityl 2-amino-2-deoxy-alpha-D-glucopyranoside ligase [Corynebacterium yudongzhengii]